MLRIKCGEESKLTSWFYEIDRGLFWLVLGLMAVGIIMSISAGAADANRIGKPWYFFSARFLLFNIVGILVMFFTSLLNKKWIKILSIFILFAGLVFLLLTLKETAINGSSRWINLHGIRFMPIDILKPAFIIITAWFFSKMHDLYGKDMFTVKDAWNPKKFCWEIYLIPFAACLYPIFKQPDFGSMILLLALFGVYVFVSGLKLRVLIPIGAVVFIIAGIVGWHKLGHIQSRSAEMFALIPRTQAWYSINSIRHGGLIGSGDESYVKDVLPEAHNDFVFSSLVEDWGALAGCALILIMFFIVKKLFQHATYAKDKFVLYTVAGTAALFVGQICFNLMTALHIFINKGMTLPFVSYGGGSLLSFCFMFGCVLALIREDTWK